MMKNIQVIITAASLGVAAVLHAAVLRPGEVEVVTAPGVCDTTKFAADELATFVGKSLGCKVPVVTSFTEGRTALVVGTNAWSVAAGVHPETLPRDSFIVKVEEKPHCGDGGGTRGGGARIYIAGCDSVKKGFKNLWNANVGAGHFYHTERASIFAVYGFLERYFGVRFYWPGDLGTIVPRHDEVVIGEEKVKMKGEQRNGSSLKKEPHHCSPSPLTFTSSEWCCFPDFTAREPSFTSPIQYLRLRAQTKYTPCCHGLASLSLRERFWDSHPEYFALRPGPNGTKVREPVLGDKVRKSHAGQLCWTSKGLWEQIHSDAVAYFSGVSAKDQGVIYHWGDGKSYGWANGYYGEYFDVMAQDGMLPCLCDDCQAAYSKTDDQYATELVWGKTVELANRLIREGVKGTLTQMAYPPYRHIPSCDIPTNVLVMVSERGPWNEGSPEAARRSDDEVRAWAKKLGRKVWLWTYPGKIWSLKLDDVPQMTPRAHGAYFKRLSPYIFGAKTESESDKPIYNYLNDYVTAKLSWDNSTDVAALLDEHHRLMFGPAADEMRGFYELLEDKWIKEIAGNTRDTEVGPEAVVPSTIELWTKVYSPDVLDRCEAYFARAKEKLEKVKVKGEGHSTSNYLERLAWIKREFCDPLVARGRRTAAMFSVKDELARRAKTNARNILPDDGETGWMTAPWTNRLVEADATAPTPPNSLHTVSYVRRYVSHHLKGLIETGKTYRISMFIKGRNVESHSTWDGGLNIEISDGKKMWRYPLGDGKIGVGFTGTFDWTHVSFDFTVGPEIGEIPYLAVRLANSTGEMWFDAPLIEEVVK